MDLTKTKTHDQPADPPSHQTGRYATMYTVIVEACDKFWS